MKIRPGSKKDKEMEKEYHIKPGSKADKRMESGKAMAQEKPMDNNSVVNDTSHIPVVNMHKKHMKLIKQHQAK